MGRTKNKLTANEIKGSLEKGRKSDGGGLYLNVTATGGKSWVFMFNQHGRRREMGLGRYPDVDLHSARRKAEKCRQQVADGRNPIEERNRDKADAKQRDITLGKAIETYLDREAFRAGKAKTTLNRWNNALNNHCKPLHGKRVNDIKMTDVLACIEDIWQTKPPTAEKTRQYLERVLEWCRGRDWLTGDNPASWDTLKNELPALSKIHTRKHHNALGWEFIPQFTDTLRAKDAVNARLLELIVLTALRSGEARGLTWAEYDPANRLLNISPERMKARKPHRVPLSERAVQLIEDMRGVSPALIFPNPTNGRQFSVNAPRTLLKRLGYEQATTHGFRTSFRGWASNQGIYSFEAVELALSHKVGSTVTQAYMRDDLLEPRREMMQAWADYCGSNHGRNVSRFLSLSKG